MKSIFHCRGTFVSINWYKNTFNYLNVMALAIIYLINYIYSMLLDAMYVK